jgi:hypothetical protein
METKFTKGVWKIDDIRNSVKTIISIKAGDPDTDDWAIFTLYNAKDEETQLANAKLIESAPIMYKMLLELSNDDECLPSFTRNKIQQLLTKIIE